MTTYQDYLLQIHNDLTVGGGPGTADRPLEAIFSTCYKNSNRSVELKVKVPCEPHVTRFLLKFLEGQHNMLILIVVS